MFAPLGMADTVGTTTTRDPVDGLSEGHVTVPVLVRSERREELLDAAVTVRAEAPEADGRLRLEVTFQDLRHAEWAMWRLGTDAEALAPEALRAALRDRAAALAARYEAA